MQSGWELGRGTAVNMMWHYLNCFLFKHFFSVFPFSLRLCCHHLWRFSFNLHRVSSRRFVIFAVSHFSNHSISQAIRFDVWHSVEVEVECVCVCVWHLRHRQTEMWFDSKHFLLLNVISLKTSGIRHSVSHQSWEKLFRTVVVTMGDRRHPVEATKIWNISANLRQKRRLENRGEKWFAFLEFRDSLERNAWQEASGICSRNRNSNQIIWWWFVPHFISVWHVERDVRTCE